MYLLLTITTNAAVEEHSKERKAKITEQKQNRLHYLSVKHKLLEHPEVRLEAIGPHHEVH